jgi:hypothetical protein
LDTTTPPFSFLNDYTLPHRAPLLQDIFEQPQLSQEELVAVRSAWAGFDSIRLALKSQGAKLAQVTSRMHSDDTRMHSAENEVRDLKRAASSHPEDQSPVVKKLCIEEAVRQIVQLQEEHRLSARRAASREEGRGLASAAPPRGSNLDGEWYFIWRGQGADQRPPINNEWLDDLLRNTLEFVEVMLNNMGRPILSSLAPP